MLSSSNEENLLPKTILYCLNPRDNEVLGTMIGNFQGEGMPAKCSSVPAGGLTIRRWYGTSDDPTGAARFAEPLCRYAD
ncbi:glucuronate isomerase [Escherichia coli]